MLLALLLLGAAPVRADAPDDEPTIRVRLLSDHHPRAVAVRAEGGALNVLTEDFSAPLLQLEDGQTVTIGQRGRELTLQSGEEELYALSLRLVPETGAAFTLQIQKGQPLDAPLRYRGALSVQPGPGGEVLRLVNAIDLETYVASVLGSEYGLDDQEGAKAMAVAIRTYALRSGGKFGAGYDHTDAVLSQRYEGTKRLTPATRQAARQTRGEVLTYDGQLIEAVYFASSGGHTADNEAVWDGKPKPYLRGKEDPYDAVSPHTDWRQSLSRPKVLDALSDYFETRIMGFYIDDRSADGRVRTLQAIRARGGTRSISSNRFRLLVNRNFSSTTLKSTFFEARRAGARYVFEGHGYGHGVGLSQWGAHAQAQRGRSYEEILSYYYTGVQLKQLEDVDTSQPRRDPPVATAPPPADAPSSPAAENTSSSPSRSASADRAPQQTASSKETDQKEKKQEQEKPRQRIGW